MSYTYNPFTDELDYYEPGAAIGSPVSGGTDNEILYIDASGNLAQSSNLTFDGVTLGVEQISSPTSTLNISPADSFLYLGGFGTNVQLEGSLTVGQYLQTTYNILDNGYGDAFITGYLQVNPLADNSGSYYLGADGSGDYTFGDINNVYGANLISINGRKIITIDGNILADGSGNSSVANSLAVNTSFATGTVFIVSDASGNYALQVTNDLVRTLNNVLDDGGAGNASILGLLTVGSVILYGGSITLNTDGSAQFGNGSASFDSSGDGSMASLGVSTNADIGGQLRLSKNPPANFPVFWLNGALYASGGTGTSTKPYAYLDQAYSVGGTEPTTWSTSGTELGMNAPSGFAGNFLDFYVNGGASVFSINASGTVKGASFVTSGGTSSKFVKGDGSLDSTAYGIGSVTTASVVSANGFAGSVATATTTPAITLSTSVTGILKGNGTAISAAAAGADYLATSANARATAQTAAVTLATFTVPAADTTYLVSANVNVTASTAFSFGVTCTYTDETNTSRVLTLSFSNLAGTFLQTITNVLGAGAYEGIPLHIRAKASTTIIIQSTGTFTTVTYNLEERIIAI